MLLSTEKTNASLYRQKQSFHSAEVELTDKIGSLEDKLDKCSTTLKTKETELNEILNLEGSRVSQIAEKAFTVIYKQKVSSSKDGYVYAHQQHGKPTRLLNIKKSAFSSSEASSSSIRKRSQIIEKVMSDVSGPVKNSDPLNADNIKQNAFVIKCNKEVFMKSAKEAGIKIVAKFDIKDAAALKAEPWEQVRMIKKAFTETFGFGVFRPEK